MEEDTEMKYRVNDNSEFMPFPPKYMKLQDHVLIYYNGSKWNVIKLEDLLQYPIIYDKYTDNLKNDKIVNDVTISFCPFSFSGVIYFGKWIPTGKIVNNNIVLRQQDNENIEIYQLSGKLLDDINTGKITIRKIEVIMMKLQTVLSNYPDCLYFHNNNTKSQLVNDQYITNKKIMYSHKNKLNNKKIDLYHPKLLVYGILRSINKETRVLVTTKKNDSFDFSKSGYKKYLNEHIEDIREEGGFIIPCFWFSWITKYPDSEIIQV